MLGSENKLLLQDLAAVIVLSESENSIRKFLVTVILRKMFPSGRVIRCVAPRLVAAANGIHYRCLSNYHVTIVLPVTQSKGL